MTVDYMTPADRLGTSLAAKRSAAIAYLRGRGKYIADIGCNFVPTNAANTDVRLTFDNATGEVVSEDRFVFGVPSLMRRQAA
jgi:hypothetical protein